MKAHIQAEPRCVLLWNFGPLNAGYDHLTRTAASFGLKVRSVGPDALNTPVGDLCAGRRTISGEAVPSPTAMSAMIISGLRHDDGTLGRFVDEVRRGGAAIPLRAMVTPTSRSWTLSALLAELCDEHAAVGGNS